MFSLCFTQQAADVTAAAAGGDAAVHVLATPAGGSGSVRGRSSTRGSVNGDERCELVLNEAHMAVMIMVAIIHNGRLHTTLLWRDNVRFTAYHVRQSTCSAVKLS